MPKNDLFIRIYVDQPVGTGYSYGTRTAKTTSEAMIDLYESIQLLLEHPLFLKFVGRPFGVWTESYGGMSNITKLSSL